jgi:hypothetical protein
MNNTPEIDTPETDGITFKATKDMMPPYDTVPSEFARRLERERDQFKKDYLDMKRERDSLIDQFGRLMGGTKN